MSAVSNPDLNVTRQDLADFYDKIFPYLGGRANAGFTPVGTVISVMGVTAPANYLACDGTVYNISDYPELAAYFGQQFSMVNKFGGDGTTTFAVPNLSGEFLRGTGTNSHANQGSGAAVGTHQDSTVIPVFAGASNGQLFIRSNSNVTNLGMSNGDATYKRNSSGTLKNNVVTATQNASSETYDSVGVRPTNTSVLWCIATKNIYMNPSLDYSTEEKVVGNYIDGSSIYQKTFTIALPSTANTEKKVAHGITNFNNAVSVNAIILSSNNKSITTLPWIDVNGNVLASIVRVDGTYIGLMANSDRSSSSALITIQYTKTT